jgi:hypothetical protein
LPPFWSKVPYTFCDGCPSSVLESTFHGGCPRECHETSAYSAGISHKVAGQVIVRPVLGNVPFDMNIKDTVWTRQ